MLLASLISQIQTESNHGDRVALLEQAIPLAEVEGNRQLWANLHALLGASLFWSASGTFDDVRITRMVAAYSAALSVYGPETTSEIWFQTQRNLASAHRLAAQVMVNDCEKHVEAAITAYFGALEHARAIAPEAYWRTCQDLLELLVVAFAWRKREALSQVERVCGNAIAAMTPEQGPQAWAAFNLQLARAIAQRGADSTEDQERSITAAEEALRVLGLENDSPMWALANLHLGGAYRTRTLGCRDENLERAAECLERAMRVFTEKDSPTEWYEAHYQRGPAYAFRIKGDRGQNQEFAIESLQIAIRHTPTEHATTLNITLGEVLSVRLAGDPAENVDRSIAAFELALSTITVEVEPVLWIRAARSLATNLLHRQSGNSAEDLEKAIGLFEKIQSLTRSAEAIAASCITDLNLALAYLQRSRGANAVDEAKAKSCLDRALAVSMKEWCNSSAWATAVSVRGDIHARQGSLDLAIADFTLLSATPEAPEQQKATAQVHQAMAYHQQGKLDLAIAAYTAALAHTDVPAEETARALLNRGIVHGAQGKSELELADYAAVLATSCVPAEQKAKALLNCGIAHAEQGKLDCAIDDYSGVMTMQDAGVEIKTGAMLNRGIVYTWQGKPDLAIADYTSVITFDGASPNQKTKALLNRADEYRRQGDLEKAIVDYVEVGEMPEAPTDLKSHAAVMRVATVVAGEQPTQGEKASARFTSAGVVSSQPLGVPRAISSVPLLVESFDTNGVQRGVIHRADRYARKKRHSCLFPGCAAKAIASHAIQRGSILEALAVDGVVYTRRQSLNPAMKVTEPIEPVDVVSMGVTEASVFNGFCPHHDSRLFAAAETTDRAAKRHIFVALHLRAVALEYARKRRVGDFYRKASELTGNPEDRTGYLASAESYLATSELQRQVYLMPLLSRDGDSYTHGIAYFCLPFSRNLRVSSCGCFQMTNEPDSGLGFNLISYTEMSILVLTTFKVWESHLDSFLGEYNLPADAERLVNDIAFSKGEEPLIAPALWQSLTPAEQREVALSLRHPAFREPGARVPQVIKINPGDLVVSGAADALARVVERLGDGLRP